MKLDAIFNKIEAHRAKVEQTRKEIEILNARLKEAQANAEDLANQGDEEGYLAIMREIREMQDRIYVKNKIVNSDAPAVSEEEMLEAWDEYALQYNKRFQNKYQAFERVRKQLCSMYADLMNEQNEILQIRKKAGDGIGITLQGLDSKGQFSFDCLPGTKPCALHGIGTPALYVNIGGMRFNELWSPLFFDAGDIDAETLKKWHGIFLFNV